MISSFSTGRDIQIVVIGPHGRVDLSHVIGFDSRQITQSVRISRLDGNHLGMEIPRGWEGSFELDRSSSEVEDFISTLEQGYFNGTPEMIGTLYQYITEPDGSTSTFQYDQVSFKLANAGQWKGDSSVRQKLDFYASRRMRVQ